MLLPVCMTHHFAARLAVTAMVNKKMRPPVDRRPQLCLVRNSLRE